MTISVTDGKDATAKEYANKLWAKREVVQEYFYQTPRIRDHALETYYHHDQKVVVRSDLKGRHRQHCLCYSCDLFLPSHREDSCPIANALYALNVLTGITTPVWECPNFETIKEFTLSRIPED